MRIYFTLPTLLKLVNEQLKVHDCVVNRLDTTKRISAQKHLEVSRVVALVSIYYISLFDFLISSEGRE